MAEPWQTLNGKVVMVTGASSGIGLGISLDLAKAGCRIIVAARRIERLRSVCGGSCGINQSCPSSATNPVVAVAVELDVAGEAKCIQEAVERSWEAFGHIDALINNAGYRGNLRSAIDTREDEWNKTSGTNARGTWLVSKYVGKRMKDNNLKGSIVNVSSITGLNRVEFQGGIAYNASKSAINSITKAMALELGIHGVRVNAIAPGLFKSEITEKLLEKDWIRNFAEKTIPLKEIGGIDPALTSVVRYTCCTILLNM